MVWWREKVVVPARRAWAAVSTRVRARNTGSGGSILKLHEDVQTCGYKDVQVMFEILRSELEDSSTPKQRKPPPAWSSRSSSIAAAQQRP
ncbi:hypothetical protein GUJ93_ZPchr0458g22371 [Zizania palustris]|uniref:Uncharacterized protein n=1 Tax=Zizania palustris TaxID=103762 RepID=A0A8J5RCC2_ZIZPA|nr:hypothetical protein GUJ93_ZPchr0305g33723 [Zizania palustris]KAG8043376.1 hypothetical protein GUJ93_ZPchr0458g22371 [Zizania palustris]